MRKKTLLAKAGFKSTSRDWATRDQCKNMSPFKIFFLFIQSINFIISPTFPSSGRCRSWCSLSFGHETSVELTACYVIEKIYYNFYCIEIILSKSKRPDFCNFRISTFLCKLNKIFSKYESNENSRLK